MHLFGQNGRGWFLFTVLIRKVHIRFVSILNQRFLKATKSKLVKFSRNSICTLDSR